MAFRDVRQQSPFTVDFDDKINYVSYSGMAVGDIDQFSSTSRSGNFKTPTPYSYTKTYLTAPYGTIRGDGNPKVTISGCLTGRAVDHSWSHESFFVAAGGQSFTDLLRDAENNAISKLIDITRNRSNDVGTDLLVSIYESPELIGLYKQLHEIIKKIRAMKLIGKVNPSVAVAEYYLLYTFGIAPLIQSIEDILSTLDKGAIKIDKIKAVGQASSFASGTTSYSSPNGQEHDFSENRFCRVIYGFDRELIDPVAAIKAQFGLNTPISSVYAVLPLSFVIDWFIDVGGYLNALEHVHSNTGYRYFHGYKTVSYLSYYEKSGNSALKDYRVSATSHARKARLDRILISSLPRPNLPTFKPRLNGGKLLSLAALLRMFTS